MTSRRAFLTRSGLALGALIVGDEMLEALDRLTHRKVFALGGMPQSTLPHGLFDVTHSVSVHRLNTRPLQWNFRITPLASPTEPLRITRL